MQLTDYLSIGNYVLQWSFFLGIVGTISGLVSLSILIYRFCSERANINIYKNIGVYFPVKFEQDTYDSPNRIAIFIRIENLSEKPNSILEFELEIPGYQKLISDSYADPLESYTIFKRNISTVKSIDTLIPVGKNQIKPIFVLSAYEAKEGMAFFPFVPDIKEEKLEGIFTVITSRKNFRTTVQIEKAKLEPETLPNN